MKSLSNNLYKSGWMSMEGKEKRVIDTNTFVSKRLEALNATLTHNESEEFAEGFTEGLQGLQVAELLGEDFRKPAFQGPDPDELIAQAKEEIAEMKKNAAMEAEQLKKNAREEGKKAGEKEGYDAGYQKGMQQTQEMQKELKEKETQMQRDYDKMLDQLEPKMVDTMSGIYQHVFNVELSQQRSIILHLLTNTLRKIEGTRDFLIHVSKDDYPYVSMHKKQIMELSGASNSTLEIIEDISLSKNDCIIETAGGIFDCGLGTQMEELDKKLKMLSYETTK